MNVRGELPPLICLAPTRLYQDLRLIPLRSERHAELKNRLMMARLWNRLWFVAYRAELDAYRSGVIRRRPKYPGDNIEVVEKEVDNYIRTLYPDYVR